MRSDGARVASVRLGDLAERQNQFSPQDVAGRLMTEAECPESLDQFVARVVCDVFVGVRAWSEEPVQLLGHPPFPVGVVGGAEHKPTATLQNAHELAEDRR